MKNQDLQNELKRLPPNAEILIQVGGHPERLPITGVELIVPPTIKLDKPGLSWSEMISDSIGGVITAAKGQTEP